MGIVVVFLGCFVLFLFFVVVVVGGIVGGGRKMVVVGKWKRIIKENCKIENQKFR